MQLFSRVTVLPEWDAGEFHKYSLLCVKVEIIQEQVQISKEKKRPLVVYKKQGHWGWDEDQQQVNLKESSLAFKHGPY